jgi:hypothetical protein
MCEYGFLAARARSTENAAIAKSSTPPRGRKTGQSCKAQQDKSVELTDCGLSALLPTQRILTQHFLALAAQGVLRRGEIPQTGRSITSERIDSKPTLRCAVFELEGRGLLRPSLHSFECPL